MNEERKLAIMVEVPGRPGIFTYKVGNLKVDPEMHQKVLKAVGEVVLRRLDREIPKT